MIFGVFILVQPNEPIKISCLITINIVLRESENVTRIEFGCSLARSITANPFPTANLT